MMKWGDFTEVDMPSLRQALGLMRKQMQVGGQEIVQHPPFTPAAIIGDNAATKGMKLAQTMHILDALASTGVTHFFLGYLYALVERNELDDAIAAMVKDERGAANDGNDG